MEKSRSFITRFYDKIILKHPIWVLICLLVLIVYLGYRAKDFKLDASAETLVLEHDKDLQYSRLIDERYGKSDYLVIAYTPKGDLFSPAELEKINTLNNELRKIDRVASVVSILDVPLLESPPVPLSELTKNIRTLTSPDVDLNLAKKEIADSPIYRNLLISPDLKTTAIQINLMDDAKYQALLTQRNTFREKEATVGISDAEQEAFAEVKKQFAMHRDRMRKVRHRVINEIRTIMHQNRNDAELFLGGVSMIADDLITFIKNDLKVFGLGVLFFLIITLKIIFRRFRWILLPMLCCACSCIAIVGLLGIFGWEVTVISSNFVSLQLIITMAITIHLIVRYRELHAVNPNTDHRQAVLESTRYMMKPCLFAALTTMAGFGSLVLCDILPVIYFGWMMIAGIAVSLILTFFIFPTVLALFKEKPSLMDTHHQFSFISFLARLTLTHGKLIMVISIIAFFISIGGIIQLDVENCFIDYFKDTTEIHQGMKVIDQKLGGTTPLDVIIDFNTAEKQPPLESPEPDLDDEFDTFDEFDEFAEEEDQEKYWFTTDKMEKILQIHNYLQQLPEAGKALSLGTMLKVAEDLNNGKPLDNFELALVFSEIPENIKETMIRPYVSVEHNQARISVRVKDSLKSLRRNELLNKIRYDLETKLGLKSDDFHLAGMLVLYNNMLQSLFDSQILTLGVVIAALMIMFMILFRSLLISLIAIFPNLMSIAVVLGFMGWMKIPLDMMTITIAAISVGIAVDDTIHYIHRFKKEFAIDRNYADTVHRCHGSIGYAMYFTSITIIIGFSILVLSNFIPSIYFGLLTGLAMLIALIAALTLLPQLLVFFKPFEKGTP